MPTHHVSKDELYAQQLIEILSDAVDVLNEAKADGIILQFQISQVAPEGHYALTSLTATKPIVMPAANDQGPPKQAPQS